MQKELRSTEMTIFIIIYHADEAELAVLGKKRNQHMFSKDNTQRRWN